MILRFSLRKYSEIMIEVRRLWWNWGGADSGDLRFWVVGTPNTIPFTRLLFAARGTNRFWFFTDRDRQNRINRSNRLQIWNRFFVCYIDCIFELITYLCVIWLIKNLFFYPKYHHRQPYLCTTSSFYVFYASFPPFFVETFPIYWSNYSKLMLISWQSKILLPSFVSIGSASASISFSQQNI